jgi:hypothetical protein
MALEDITINCFTFCNKLYQFLQRFTSVKKYKSKIIYQFLQKCYLKQYFIYFRTLLFNMAHPLINIKSLSTTLTLMTP